MTWTNRNLQQTPKLRVLDILIPHRISTTSATVLGSQWRRKRQGPRKSEHAAMNEPISRRELLQAGAAASASWPTASVYAVEVPQTPCCLRGSIRLAPTAACTRCSSPLLAASPGISGRSAGTHNGKARNEAGAARNGRGSSQPDGMTASWKLKVLVEHCAVRASSELCNPTKQSESVLSELHGSCLDPARGKPLPGLSRRRRVPRWGLSTQQLSN